MAKTNLEILFDWLDQTTESIIQHEDEPYLDSLAVAMEALFYEHPSEEVDDILSHKLNKRIKEIDLNIFNREEIRKAIQLAILKGMQRSTQQHHFITPETVALLVGYLARKVTNEEENLRVFDPVCGTANLLTTVLSQLDNPGESFGSEIDSTLIKLALYNANLQKMNIEFFNQDSLRPFLIDPVDLIVADLPVGYYPDDEHAMTFNLKADEGHSYSHHLFIEQSMNYTKNSGYLLLLVPEFIFDSDQSDKLNEYLHENAHIVGLLRLPESAFASKRNVKSILILQKKGPETSTPKQPLLVDLPSFNNTIAMEDILGQINEWFINYQNNNSMN